MMKTISITISVMNISAFKRDVQPYLDIDWFQLGLIGTG